MDRQLRRKSFLMNIVILESCALIRAKMDQSVDASLTRVLQRPAIVVSCLHVYWKGLILICTGDGLQEFGTTARLACKTTPAGHAGYLVASGWLACNSVTAVY